MRATVALAAGLSLIAIAVGVAVTRSPPSVAWTDQTPLRGTVAYMAAGSRACQGGETLPPAVTAVRLSLYAGLGPRVRVDVSSGARLLTHGVRDAGWRGESPTVALAPAPHGASDVELCFSVGSSGESVGLDGEPAKPGQSAVAQNGRSLGVRLRTEYLRSGNRSWISLATIVARHMGQGRWAAGAWIAPLVLILVAAIVAAVVWLAARELQ